MPVQKSKSTLFDRLGGAKRFGKIVKDHAHDPIRGGMSDLPPNIKNGVARLTKLYIAQYVTGDNKGKDYLRGEAVVLGPKKTRDGDRMVAIEGLTTTLGPLALCETKNASEEDNVTRALEEIKKLGVTADELAEQGSEEGGIEAMLEALVEAEPFVRFSTSPKFAQDDVKKEREPTGSWQNWNGVLADYDSGATEDVEDSTGGREPKADVEEDELTSGKANGKLPAKKGKAPVEDEPADDEPDLDALAEKADEQEDDDEQQEARKTLTELGVAAGLSKKWISDVAKSWTAVAEKIKEKSGSSDEPEETAEPEEDAPYEPSKDDIVKYKGKKDKKPMEYEVLAVDKRKKTCELKSIDDGKTKYVGVPWDEVEASE